MQDESNEKVETEGADEQVYVTTKVSKAVHRKIAQYKRRIMVEKQRDFTLMEAYAEFLTEKTSDITLVP